MFSVSILKKYVQDEGHIRNFTGLKIQHDVGYVEKIVKILGKEENFLKRKAISLIKVLG